MSSYSCVVPIDWSRLWGDLIPAWCEVFSASRSMISFCQQFAPEQLEFERLYSNSLLRQAIPPGYLDDIGWKFRRDFLPAGNLRASRLHARLIKKTGTEEVIFCRAIKESCSAQLPGPDRFSSSPCNGYYSTLRRFPNVQVAGFKNSFHFLEAIFEVEYDAYNHVYHYRDRLLLDPETTELLTALFLATRAWPGIEVLACEPCWPGSDDTYLQGYLNPTEVEALASRLDEIASLQVEDELLPLFVDRVQRAATGGFGLMTMHAGL